MRLAISPSEPNMTNDVSSDAHAEPHDRRRWIALLVLCMGVLMIVLDTTIVNVALPSIKTDLKFTDTSLA